MSLTIYQTSPFKNGTMVRPINRTTTIVAPDRPRKIPRCSLFLSEIFFICTTEIVKIIRYATKFNRFAATNNQCNISATDMSFSFSVPRRQFFRGIITNKEGLLKFPVTFLPPLRRYRFYFGLIFHNCRRLR